MKPTFEQYASDLIDKYNKIGLQLRNEAIQCAIIDVTNTIESLMDLENTEFSIDYFNQVLIFLKSKT